MKQAISPTGAKIIGTVERIPGVALATVTFTEGGGLSCEYDGETKVDWDNQKTVKDFRGEAIYIDADGERWSEREVIAATKGQP